MLTPHFRAYLKSFRLAMYGKATTGAIQVKGMWCVKYWERPLTFTNYVALTKIRIVVEHKRARAGLRTETRRDDRCVYTDRATGVDRLTWCAAGSLLDVDSTQPRSLSAWWWWWWWWWWWLSYTSFHSRRHSPSSVMIASCSIHWVTAASQVAHAVSQLGP